MPSEPGDAGWSWGKGVKAVFNVATRFARSIGSGLNLVNAVLNRFPGLTKLEAGTVSAAASGAIAAADKLTRLPEDARILSIEWPVLTGESMWSGMESSRWQAETITQWEDDTGARSLFQTTVHGTQDLTKKAFDEMVDFTSREGRARYYMAKKANDKLVSVTITTALAQY